MVQRHLTEKILRDLKWSPVVGIVGSRQVGKTTLAKYLQTQIEKETIYLDLELTSDLLKLEDAEGYLLSHTNKCVIIDEVQMRPELFTLLRALVDKKREPARYILLGSASPHIIKKNTETLAGRISYHELPPFSYSEIKEQFTLEEHLIRGGFPDALLPDIPFVRRKWMDDFVETFIYRDLNQLGINISTSILKNLIGMVSHLHGGLLNASNMANSIGVTSPTIKRYLGLLEGSYILRELRPYFKNVGKRLTRSPKIYLRDSGLLHHLHRISDMEQFRGHPLAGASWEGYCIEQIIREAPEFSEFYYYRTSNGAELDLVMISPKGKMAVFEFKFSIAPTVSKGFYSCIEDLKPQYQFVLTPTSERLERSNGTIITSLPDFLENDLQGLE